MKAVLVSMLGDLQPQKDLRTGWPDVLSGGYLTGDVRGARAGRIGREPECPRSDCPPFWSVVEISASQLRSEKETSVRELLRRPRKEKIDDAGGVESRHALGMNVESGMPGGMKDP